MLVADYSINSIDLIDFIDVTDNATALPSQGGQR
jgi:hypothetical protein